MKNITVTEHDQISVANISQMLFNPMNIYDGTCTIL